MATLYSTNPKGTDRLAQLWEDLLADAAPTQPPAPQEKTVCAAVRVNQEEPMRRTWRVDPLTLFQSVLEPDAVEPPQPAAVPAIPEGEAYPELSIEAAHEAALGLSSPFHWEPKPAWVNMPGNSAPGSLNPADPQCFAFKPRVPFRPLHKQPFYRRFYFYLHRWLSRPR